MPELKNKRHEAFCQEYLKDLNATQAYMRVYSKTGEEAARRSASDFMTKPDILTRVKELTNGRSERCKIDIDNVLNSLIEIRDRCMSAEPVLDHEGERTGEWKFDSRGALKANELLGRHLGAWNDKLKVDGEIKTIEQVIRESIGRK